MKKSARRVPNGGRNVNTVLDTNILVSGLLWSGLPRQILAAARTQQIIFTSQELLDELHRVLQRPKFAARLHVAGAIANELIDQYTALAQIVVSASLPAPVCDDPDDDAVIACAVAASAEVIVSGDDDLLRLGSYGSIAILMAGDVLQRLAPPTQPLCP